MMLLLGTPAPELLVSTNVLGSHSVSTSGETGTQEFSILEEQLL